MSLETVMARLMELTSAATIGFSGDGIVPHDPTANLNPVVVERQLPPNSHSPKRLGLPAELEALIPMPGQNNGRHPEDVGAQTGDYDPLPEQLGIADLLITHEPVPTNTPEDPNFYAIVYDVSGALPSRFQIISNVDKLVTLFSKNPELVSKYEIRLEELPAPKGAEGTFYNLSWVEGGKRFGFYRDKSVTIDGRSTVRYILSVIDEIDQEKIIYKLFYFYERGGTPPNLVKSKREDWEFLNTLGKIGLIEGVYEPIALHMQNMGFDDTLHPQTMLEEMTAHPEKYIKGLPPKNAIDVAQKRGPYEQLYPERYNPNGVGSPKLRA